MPSTAANATKTGLRLRATVSWAHTEALSKAGLHASDPSQGPVGLLLDELKLEDRTEQRAPEMRNFIRGAATSLAV